MHGRAGAWHHQRNPRISPVLSARFEGGRGCVGSGVSSFQSEAAAYADKWTIVLPDDFSDRLLGAMINARASVSLAGAAHQRGVAGRAHAHRGLCARLLGAAMPQDVHEASTLLGWTLPR